MKLRGISVSTLVLAVFATASMTGCGNSDRDEQAVAAPLIVSAATSLKRPFEQYGATVPGGVRLQFAGSDDLAAQIRQGVRPDLFASANTSLPEALHEEGLVEQPKVFAANQLVLAIPASGGKVHSLDDLSAPGVTVAIGAETVPIGAYTRTVLDRLGADQSRAILANVRSNEPDVGGVVGKVAQGAVDAGFVYATDVAAASGKLTAVELPTRLQPAVAYGVAIVTGSPRAEAAQAFIDGLLDGDGADALQAAGFTAAP